MGGGREGERKQYGQSGDTDHPIFIDEITVIMEYNFYWSHDPHISWPGTVSTSKHATMLMKSQ